jgi:transcriptional regulator with XRE-family HTH domain
VKDVGIKDAVTHRFAALCSQRGIELNELAVRSGVTPSTVYSMMDKRRRDVSIVTIKILCDGLDISLTEFFSGEEFADLEQEIQ